MHARTLFLFAAAFSTAGLYAQRSSLSIGLNGIYAPTPAIGLGATLDYRWRLNAHVEAIGQVGLTRFWHPDRSYADRSAIEAGGNLYHGGLGVGYRGRPQGFHIGLLAGGLAYEEVRAGGGSAYVTRPALGLTLGHGIGQHWDVSVDSWSFTTAKGEFFALPLLRISYLPFGKH